MFNRRTTGLALVLGAAVVVDILLRVVARASLEAATTFVLVTPVGFIGFVPSVNDRLAFSLPVPNAVIWPVGWIVLAALIGSAWRSAARVRLACAVILTGAIPNLIERSAFGGVTDYLALTRAFPAFNIADCAILLGLFAWCIAMRSTDK